MISHVYLGLGSNLGKNAVQWHLQVASPIGPERPRWSRVEVFDDLGRQLTQYAIVMQSQSDRAGQNAWRKNEHDQHGP